MNAKLLFSLVKQDGRRKNIRKWLRDRKIPERNHAQVWETLLAIIDGIVFLLKEGSWNMIFNSHAVSPAHTEGE